MTEFDTNSCIMIRLPDHKMDTFLIDGKTIGDLYRYIRNKTKRSMNEIYVSHVGRILDLSDSKKRLTEIFTSTFACVDVNFKMMAGPRLEKTEQALIKINLPNRSDPDFIIKFHPSQTVRRLLFDIWEYLDQQEEFNNQIEDFELWGGNDSLNPNKELAEFPQISITYLNFISPEEMKNSIISHLIKNDHYYQSLILGKSIQPIPILELRPITEFFPEKKTKCLICCKSVEGGRKIILEKCRHIFCQFCLDQWYLSGKNTCPTCRQNF